MRASRSLRRTSSRGTSPLRCGPRCDTRAACRPRTGSSRPLRACACRSRRRSRSCLRDDEILAGARRMAVGILDRACREPELVKLDAARLIEREQRARAESAILARQQLRLGCAQHERAGLRARADQRRERDLERTRDLPQHVDRRCALTELDLAEHRARHAGDLREPFERQARGECANVAGSRRRSARDRLLRSARRCRNRRGAASSCATASRPWLATFGDLFLHQTQTGTQYTHTAGDTGRRADWRSSCIRRRER